MADTKIEKIIAEISGILKTTYADFKGIYFFGSRTRGDYRSDSDYDLLFLFERKISWEFREEIRHRIYEYEDTYGVAIDPKIINAKEFEMNRMPFIQNVIRDGLYYGS